MAHDFTLSFPFLDFSSPFQASSCLSYKALWPPSLVLLEGLGRWCPFDW